MADITINNLTGQAPSLTDVFPFSTTGVGPATYKATLSQLKSSMSLNNVENKSSATIRSEITSSNVTTALGYTPYNSTNPAGYITASSLPSSQQLAKAWVVFNWNGSAVVIRASYNVSSVTRVFNGTYDIAFPVGLFSDGFYAIAGCSGYTGSTNMGTITQNYGYNNTTATNCRISCTFENGTAPLDPSMARVIFYR